MKWQARSTDGDVSGVIVRDEKAGYYLYLCRDEKCVADYLQDTFDDAVETAAEIAGISKGEWILDPL